MFLIISLSDTTLVRIVSMEIGVGDIYHKFRIVLYLGVCENWGAGIGSNFHWKEKSNDSK